MKNGIFTRWLAVSIALLALNLGACATLFEFEDDRDPASMDRGYTEEDEDCAGRFCEQDDEEDSEVVTRAPASINNRVQRAISARDIVLGMTRQEVEASWGTPNLREVAGNGSSGHERWTYGGRFSLSGSRTVIFENGRVAGWHR